MALIWPLRKMGQASVGEPGVRLHTAVKQPQSRLWLLLPPSPFTDSCSRFSLGSRENLHSCHRVLPCRAPLAVSLLYIFIYLCSRQFVSYLSFLLPSVIVLINRPLERLYFFLDKKKNCETVFCSHVVDYGR